MSFEFLRIYSINLLSLIFGNNASSFQCTNILMNSYGSYNAFVIFLKNDNIQLNAMIHGIKYRYDYSMTQQLIKVQTYSDQKLS